MVSTFTATDFHKCSSTLKFKFLYIVVLGIPKSPLFHVLGGGEMYVQTLLAKIEDNVKLTKLAAFPSYSRAWCQRGASLH